MRTFTGLLFATLFSVLGCRATAQAHLFPKAWSSSLERPELPEKATVDSSPSVLVEPIAFDQGDEQGHLVLQEGSRTDEIVRDLLIGKLRASGVGAHRQGDLQVKPDYRLICVMTKLLYSEQAGYPKQIRYVAGLVCRLEHTESRRVLWQRDLEYPLERSVLVDTMTRIPDGQREHERILIQKCLLPVLDWVASGVKGSLKEREV
ncbi:MAG: hypothetical protein NC819_01845 [Candidatus Omnitrophica bacterium]|nr:hypothetical protein [Candidatus Omnitrophota bacterium]